MRQHYLPSVYLKQFSADGPRATRKSFVWRVDAVRAIRGTVETQGYEEAFYSRLAPEAAEELFKGLEMAYGLMLKRIWLNGDPTSTEYFGLILMMFDLHLRGVGYKNLSPQDNATAYQRRAQSFLDQVLIADGRHGHSYAESLGHLKKHWRVRLLNAPSENGLITSDSPALWFVTAGDENVRLAIMPVTPGHLAVAFDARFFDVRGNDLTKQDADVLNHHQIHHCAAAVFFRDKPDNQDVATVQNALVARDTPGGTDDGEKWEMSVLRLPPGAPFAFLHARAWNAGS